MNKDTSITSKFERWAVPSDTREAMLSFLEENEDIATLLAEALHVVEYLPYVERVTITGRQRDEEQTSVIVWVYLIQTEDFDKLETAFYYLWEQKFSELDEDIYVAVL